MNKFRIENKYKIESNKICEFYNFLGKNSFKVLHPKRNILSIYFDNQKMSSYNESIEGLVPRKKIRLRTYPNIKKKTFENKFNLEIKINAVEGKYKTSKKCDEIFNFLYGGYHDYDYGLCFPIIEVSYEREYFFNNDIRITLDNQLQYRYFKNITFEMDKNIIMEIKSNKIDIGNKIEEIYGLQKTRFSKYCEAIEILSLDK